MTQKRDFQTCRTGEKHVSDFCRLSGLCRILSSPTVSVYTRMYSKKFKRFTVYYNSFNTAFVSTEKVSNVSKLNFFESYYDFFLLVRYLL